MNSGNAKSIEAMQTPFVSVIIPTFNNEGTIEATLNSICKQVYRNLEIIVIDDGSTDGTGRICDAFARRNKKIKVFHQKNRGMCNARNRGMAEARSKYICFVDGDDEIEETYVSDMLFSLLETQADLIVCGISVYEKTKSFRLSKENTTMVLAENSLSEWQELFGTWELIPAWNKLFCKEIIINNGLQWNEELTCGEDEVFAYEYIQHCDKVTFVETALYNYYSFRANTANRCVTSIVKQNTFKKREQLLQTYCADDELEWKKYLSRIAVKFLRQRIEYTEKRAYQKANTYRQMHIDIRENIDFFWPYIEPFIHEEEIFSKDDWKWLCDNKYYVENRKIWFFFRNMILNCFKKRFVG